MAGIDLSSLIQVAEIGLALETGGASAALEAVASQAIQQVATQAFQGALSQLSGLLSQLGADAGQLVKAFTSGFQSATGSNGGSSDASQQLLDSSNSNGQLTQTLQNLQNQMANLIDELGGQGQQSDGSSGGSGGAGNNWMEAIARAMGEALGKLSQKVVDESQQLNSLAGDSSSSGAQQFQSVMAQFQADSQTLSMLSNAFANAIKSIGQGLQTMASKQ